MFVSGDEGGDVLSSSSGAGVSAEGSTEGRHSDRVQVRVCLHSTFVVFSC